MQTLHYQTVIIGSGFAGRTVADHLPKGSYIILDRGENRDFADMLKRYEAAAAEEAAKPSPDLVQAQAVAYQSDLPWNASGRLSKWNYSRYAFIRGGASNWWGGKATRFEQDVFTADGPIPWALSYAEMSPWYEKAEQRLNVSGDPEYATAKPVSPMPGADNWRDAFKPYFRDARLYNTAINKTPKTGAANSQGFCQGRSNCAVCREDAKARPDTIFGEQPMLFATMAMEILFDGERAVAVECFDGRQVFQITFERIVVAANGLETPRLLHRSSLPRGVRRAQIGAFYQDHAHLEISCKIPKKLIYGNVGGLSHVYVKEVSGNFTTTAKGNIGVSALALTHEPSQQTFLAGMRPELLKNSGVAMFLEDANGCFDIFAELEIPPEAGFTVVLDAEVPLVHDETYPEWIAAFDDVARQIRQKLIAVGVEVLKINPIYRTGYGGHHFCGTVNMSAGDNSVLDRDMRVIGIHNVYVAGAAVIPRAGGIAPTLTLVALAEKLGTHLSQAA
jgi:choline dehydrogenase-like flavoprotein